MEEIIKKIIEEKMQEEIKSKIEVETKKFYRELTERKDQYISEIMNGIRIYHERDEMNLGMNYTIIFKNFVRLEK